MRAPMLCANRCRTSSHAACPGTMKASSIICTAPSFGRMWSPWYAKKRILDICDLLDDRRSPIVGQRQNDVTMQLRTLPVRRLHGIAERYVEHGGSRQPIVLSCES